LWRVQLAKAEKKVKTSVKVTKKVKSVKASTGKLLKKEVDLPIPTPKNKAGKFLGKKRRVRMPKYFRESWKEVKKVTWPTRKEALKLSFAVVVFTVIFATFTSLVDYGFNQLVERIFL